MRVCYLLPILPPHMPRAEAFLQEITALRGQLPSELVYLNPNRQAPVYIPRLLFGFHLLPKLWRLGKAVDLYHFYNADLFAFPVLRWLRRPVVYTVAGGIGSRRPNIAFLNSLSAVTVADEAMLTQLQTWGLRNGTVVRSGVDVARFTRHPLPIQGEIRLLMGSAPWTEAQFQSKGVDALLAAAQQRLNLHLVFLWRGVLADAIQARVRQLGLERQVTIHNQLVDVNQVLANVHASVVLATDGNIVKAYPHSLLDSLAAGKPVLVSPTLAMATYVAQTGCGVVVERVDAAAILAALDQLVDQYEPLAASATTVGQRDFTLEKTLATYRAVYARSVG